MGFEIDPCKERPYGAVAPGLCLGATKDMPLYWDILSVYRTLRYINDDGSQNMKTVVLYVTEILRSKGLSAKSGIQKLEGINIYPKEYFNPLDSLTGRLVTTPNTRSIHWYTMSWLDQSPLRTRMSRLLHRIISPEITTKLKRVLTRK